MTRSHLHRRDSRAALRQDVAACVALSASLGDPPAPDALELARSFGYFDNDGNLTEAGENAAADASGFMED